MTWSDRLTEVQWGHASALQYVIRGKEIWLTQLVAAGLVGFTAHNMKKKRRDELAIMRQGRKGKRLMTFSMKLFREGTSHVHVRPSFRRFDLTSYNAYKKCKTTLKSYRDPFIQWCTQSSLLLSYPIKQLMPHLPLLQE